MPLDLAGLTAATAVPMSETGAIDEPALRSYIRWVADQGVVALAINVDTGETAHLTHTERCRILEVVKEEVSVPLIAGVAGPTPDKAVSDAKDFQAAGADGLLVFPIPAYLSQPLDPRIPVNYHADIARVGLPMILFQLQPALAGVLYERTVLEQLLHIDNVVAIKEASFDCRRFMDVANVVAGSSTDVALLTGNDNFIIESFFFGAVGALIGFGAIMTREQVEMIKAWQQGRHQEAVDLARPVQKLADAVFAPPVGDYRARIKACLQMLGVIEQRHVRRPMLTTSDEECAHLRQVLVDVGLL